MATPCLTWTSCSTRCKGCVRTNLDLKKAYHQVELHPDSRKLTAFITHGGLFQYCRVPLGLDSSGPCFQRIMEGMLNGIKGVSDLTVYLDDVVIQLHCATKAESLVPTLPRSVKMVLSVSYVV